MEQCVAICEAPFPRIFGCWGDRQCQRLSLRVGAYIWQPVQWNSGTEGVLDKFLGGGWPLQYGNKASASVSIHNQMFSKIWGLTNILWKLCPCPRTAYDGN